MLLLLDLADAFDSIACDFMFKTLKMFNFGDKLMQWI